MHSDAELHALLARIANELGTEWQAEVMAYEHAPNTYYLYLRHIDGLSLYVAYIAEKEPGALHISTTYPTDMQRVIGVSNTSINVSVARGPVTIAREIERRLLPDATRYWQEAQTDYTEYLVAEISRQAAKEELLHCGLRIHEKIESTARDPQLTFSGHDSLYGDLRIGYSGRELTTLTIHWVPLALAEQILELVRDYATEEA